MDRHTRFQRAIMLEEALNELSVRAQEADFPEIEYMIVLAMNAASEQAERLKPKWKIADASYRFEQSV